MGINTKFGKVAATTYSAPSQTGAAYVITWTSNEPTAGTTATIANGTIPTVAELGQAVQDLTTQLNKNVVDIASLMTAVAQSAADNAAMLAQLNAGE